MERVYINTMKMMTEHYCNGQKGKNKRKEYINKKYKSWTKTFNVIGLGNIGNKPHGNVLFCTEKKVNCRKQYMYLYTVRMPTWTTVRLDEVPLTLGIHFYLYTLKRLRGDRGTDDATGKSCNVRLVVCVSLYACVGVCTWTNRKSTHTLTHTLLYVPWFVRIFSLPHTLFLHSLYCSFDLFHHHACVFLSVFNCSCDFQLLFLYSFIHVPSDFHYVVAFYVWCLFVNCILFVNVYSFCFLHLFWLPD